MKFDIKNYHGNYVMHCKTKDEAKDFCNYLHKHGERWGSGSSYKEYTYWDIYRSKTAYYFNNGAYGHIDSAKRDGLKILEWSDFMYNEFTKADLRTGDVILRRNGKVEILNRELGVFICDCGGWNDFDKLKDDLTTMYIDNQYDIMEVRRPLEKCDCCFDAMKINGHHRGVLVYERKEVEEMTLAEVCRLLGKEIKIVK